MLFLQHTPLAALKSLVVDMFLMHFDLPERQSPILCPFPPTPLQFLAFYLDDQVTTKKHGNEEFKTRGRCVVVGPQATRMSLLVRRSHKAFVITFRPGGLYRLLGIPLHELYDDGFEGRELMGPEIESLTNQILEAGSFHSMTQIAETFLLKKLLSMKPILPLDSALQQLITANGMLAIDHIASLSCLSIRQFERKCKERLGYSPKFLARLARFSKAYRLREQQPSLSWTSIAHETGYYDQMHFIRDFKQFAGITPTGLDREMDFHSLRMQANIKI